MESQLLQGLVKYRREEGQCLIRRYATVGAAETPMTSDSAVLEQLDVPTERIKEMDYLLEFSDREEYSEQFLSEVDYQVRTRGYAVVPNYFDDQECELFRAILSETIGGYDPAGVPRRQAEQHQMHDLLYRSHVSNKILEDPRLQQIMALFLTEAWILYGFTTSSLPPGGGNYASRIHVDSPRMIPGCITNMSGMFALDDFTSLNGATRVMPGSQFSSVHPSQDMLGKYGAEVLCKKGAFIIMNSRVFHQAGVNRSDSWRHALTINACRPYMKQRMDWVRFIPSEISDQLNAQARRIIGFDTRLPSNLEEYFLPDDTRLYKSGQEEGQI